VGRRASRHRTWISASRLRAGRVRHEAAQVDRGDRARGCVAAGLLGRTGLGSGRACADDGRRGHGGLRSDPRRRFGGRYGVRGRAGNLARGRAPRRQRMGFRGHP
jgi:hypothetical protein